MIGVGLWPCPRVGQSDRLWNWPVRTRPTGVRERPLFCSTLALSPSGPVWQAMEVAADQSPAWKPTSCVFGLRFLLEYLQGLSEMPASCWNVLFTFEWKVSVQMWLICFIHEPFSSWIWFWVCSMWMLNLRDSNSRKNTFFFTVLVSALRHLMSGLPCDTTGQLTWCRYVWYNTCLFTCVLCINLYICIVKPNGGHFCTSCVKCILVLDFACIEELGQS